MAVEKIGEVVVDGATRPITVDPQSGRFEIRVDVDEAFIQFRRRGSVLSLIHTEVPKPVEKKGVAAALARAALEYARAHGMTVRPICPYVAKFIARHQEFQDLVEPDRS
jgi:predicted GNAT family acetyltransferase